VAIATINEPTLEDISNLADVPISSLKRHIKMLRQHYLMDIRFDEHKAEKGRTGHYHIYDWGYSIKMS
jgi:hypothetical protein